VSDQIIQADITESQLFQLAQRIESYVNAVLDARFGESAYYSRECPATEQIRDETAAALVIARQEFMQPLNSKNVD